MDGLPKAAHPTAKAFFDALDRYNNNNNDDDNSSSSNGQDEDDGCGNDDSKEGAIAATNDPRAAPAMMSESLRRKSQSLGWRNRFSQNEFYPVSMMLPAQPQEPSVSSSNNETETTGASDTANGEGGSGGDDDDPSAARATLSRSTNQQQQQQPQKQQQQQQRDRFLRRSFSVEQVQRGEVEGTYGTGATVWPAALVLIKYLEHQQKKLGGGGAGGGTRGGLTVGGKHVIDLGAGTGVTSIAAALLGAASVVCTDGEDPVVELARSNVLRAAEEPGRRTESATRAPVASTTTTTTTTATTPVDGDASVATIEGCPVRAERYWWGDEPPTVPDTSGEKSRGLVVLVADRVLPKLYPMAPLMQAIDDCLRLGSGCGDGNNDNNNDDDNDDACALLSYEHRYYPDYDPRTEFRWLASERGLEVSSVPLEEMDPVYSLEDVELWIVRRSPR